MTVVDSILQTVDTFDVTAVQAVNAMAGEYPIFDLIVLRIFRLDSVRHFPLVAILIWAWYSDPGDGSRRKHVFDGVTGYMISIFLTRLVQDLLPHRPRPALAGTFHFEMPVGGFTNDWSSFPSDTAAQGFALAFAIGAMSRRLGVFAYFWAAAIICFPRLYGGFHYPSDLIAGALAGMTATWIVSRRPLGLNRAAAAVDRWEVNCRPWFYIAGFFLLYQIMAHLGEARDVIMVTKQIVDLLVR